MKPARATAPVKVRNRSPPASSKSIENGPTRIGAATETVCVNRVLTTEVSVISLLTSDVCVRMLVTALVTTLVMTLVKVVGMPVAIVTITVLSKVM